MTLPLVGGKTRAITFKSVDLPALAEQIQIAKKVQEFLAICEELTLAIEDTDSAANKLSRSLVAV